MAAADVFAVVVCAAVVPDWLVAALALVAALGVAATVWAFTPEPARPYGIAACGCGVPQDGGRSG